MGGRDIQNGQLTEDTSYLGTDKVGPYDRTLRQFLDGRQTGS
jgi:hypothetical protein